MPIAKVYYKELKNGDVIIEKLSGFMTTQEIINKYGKDVYDLYLEKKKIMYAHQFRKEEVIVSGAILKKGDVLSRTTLDKFVDMMKERGSNLAEAVKEKRNKVFCIEI